MATHLSVNLNKVALLRNSRGASNPSPQRAAETVIAAGARGLTLHWRQDNRHTRAEDVRELRALAADHGVELNLEGDTRAELIELGIELRVDQLTLVPVTPGEITSDHGWDLPRQHALLAPLVARAKDAGIRTAIFMDAATETMAAAAATGVDRIEIYTEPYAAAWGTERLDAELERVAECAAAATALGLGINAGHDLDLHNLPRLVRRVPTLLEVSIGHALIADALYLGLHEATQRYVRACAGDDVEAPLTC